MFGKFFGPKNTFKDALLILEKGLRRGEIVLEAERENEAPISRRPQSRHRLHLEILEQRDVPSVPLIFSDNLNLPVGSQPSSSTWTAFNATDPNNPNVGYTNGVSTLQVAADSHAFDGRALAMLPMPDPKSSPVNPSYYSFEIVIYAGPVAGDLLDTVQALMNLARGPNRQGDRFWPGFWMLENAVGFPFPGEIDIMENKRSTPGEIQCTICGSSDCISAGSGYDKPTFSWNAAAGADQYYLAVLDHNTGTAPVVVSNVSGTSYVTAAAQALTGHSFTTYVSAVSTNENDSPINPVELYVPLLNDGSNVLRPTTGLLLAPDLVQVLATTDYDPSIETWEFPPGSKVRCVSEMRGGRKLLVARQRID